MDALCIDFINSEFRDFRGRWARDDLQQPGWLEKFLVSRDIKVETPPDEAAIAALISLRDLLKRMIESVADGQIADDDLAKFNAILLKVPLKRSLNRDAGGYRLELLPVKKDWDWVQAEIAASLAHLLSDHDPRRLKICANVYCRGAFFDDSKSRTKRYCTPEKCGNLWKARRFRARHKGKQE